MDSFNMVEERSFVSFPGTVTPRNTGRQGTNKFYLILTDFCYCQYRKLKEMSRRDQGVTFVIGGFPLLLFPVLRGLTITVSYLSEIQVLCKGPTVSKFENLRLGH